MGMQRVEPLVKRLGTFLAELSVFKEELVKRAENLSTEMALHICRGDHSQGMQGRSRDHHENGQKSPVPVRATEAARLSGSAKRMPILSPQMN